MHVDICSGMTYFDFHSHLQAYEATESKLYYFLLNSRGYSRLLGHTIVRKLVMLKGLVSDIILPYLECKGEGAAQS